MIYGALLSTFHKGTLLFVVAVVVFGSKLELRP